MLNYLNELVLLNTSENKKEFIYNYLLFTLVGFVIHENKLTIFNAGDGLYNYNGEMVVIEQDNRPKYLAYGLFEKKQSIDYISYPIENLEYLLIASDGLEDLFDLSYGIADFMDENIFDREHLLSEFLLTSMKQNKLRDDTTVVICKRL